MTRRARDKGHGGVSDEGLGEGRGVVDAERARLALRRARARGALPRLRNV